jgi:hypothetical protein
MEFSRKRRDGALLKFRGAG